MKVVSSDFGHCIEAVFVIQGVCESQALGLQQEVQARRAIGLQGHSKRVKSQVPKSGNQSWPPPPKSVITSWPPTEQSVNTSWPPTEQSGNTSQPPAEKSGNTS